MFSNITQWIKNALGSKSASEKRVPARFRPRTEALEDRLVQSATSACSLPVLKYGQKMAEFRVDNNHHLQVLAQGDKSWHSVPGAEKWSAWNVKAVRNKAGDIEIFANGTDGHLWEITRRNNGSFTGWTDMKRNFLAFDVVFDHFGNVDVFGIDKSQHLSQVTHFADGHWSTYWDPSHNSLVRDVAALVDQKGALQVFVVGLNSHSVFHTTEDVVSGGKTYRTNPWVNDGGSFDHINAPPCYDPNVNMVVSAWKNGNACYAQYKTQNIRGNWSGWHQGGI